MPEDFLFPEDIDPNYTQDKILQPKDVIPGGQTVSTSNESITDYLAGLLGRAGSGATLGLADAATRTGNPLGDVVRPALDATGLSQVPMWGGGGPIGALVSPVGAIAGAFKGQNLDQFNAAQQQFRTEHPVASRMAEATPAAVVGGLATAGMGPIGIAAGGSIEGMSQGLVDEGITSSVKGQPFNMEAAADKALVGGITGGAVSGGLAAAGRMAANAAQRGTLGSLMNPEEIALSRLRQAGVTKDKLLVKLKSMKGGLPGAADELLESGAISRLGETGKVDIEKMFVKPSAALQALEEAGQGIRVSPAEIAARVETGPMHRFGKSNTSFGARANDAIQAELGYIKPGDKSLPELEQMRKELYKQFQNALKPNSDPASKGLSEYRRTITDIISDSLDDAGSSGKLHADTMRSYARASTIEEGLGSGLSRGSSGKPDFGATMVGANRGLLAGAAYHAYGKRAPAVRATFGEVMLNLSRAGKLQSSPLSNATIDAARRGPSALSAALYNIAQVSPVSNAELRKIGEKKAEAEKLFEEE